MSTDYELLLKSQLFTLPVKHAQNKVFAYIGRSAQTGFFSPLGVSTKPKTSVRDGHDRDDYDMGR